LRYAGLFPKITASRMTGDDTVNQNSDWTGVVKELLMYTPPQVNLLAHMWTWAILDIADDLRRLV
jgi:hypothetical protein